MGSKEKCKTHSGAKKRFKFTATGKIKYKHAGRSHLLADKSSKRMRKLRRKGYLGTSEKRVVRAMLPYGR
mgnify:CR=1 FL=1